MAEDREIYFYENTLNNLMALLKVDERGLINNNYYNICYKDSINDFHIVAQQKYYDLSESEWVYPINSFGETHMYGNILFYNTLEGLQDQFLTIPIPISESGITALDLGFTAVSIVGCLNELVNSISSYWTKVDHNLYPTDLEVKIGIQNTTPNRTFTLGGDIDSPMFSLNRSTISWTEDQKACLGFIGAGEAWNMGLNSNTLGGLYINSFSNNISSGFGIVLNSYNINDLTTNGSFTFKAIKYDAGEPLGLKVHGAAAKIFNIMNYNIEYFKLLGNGTITLGAYGLGIIHSSIGGVLSSSAIINTDLGGLGTLNYYAKFAATGLADSLLSETANDVIIPTTKRFGLGTGKGGITFVDATIDTITFDNCHVGIGVTPPLTPGYLKVLSLSGGMSSASSCALELQGKRTTGAGEFGSIIGYNQTVNCCMINFIRDGADDAGAIVFSSRAAGGSIVEKMRLNSKGILGIDVIPQAWYTDLSVLQVGCYGSIVSEERSSSGGGLRIAHNWYLDAAGAGRTWNPNSDECSIFNQANGVFYWASETAQVAGLVSPQNKMSLDLDGNLSIFGATFGANAVGCIGLLNNNPPNSAVSNGIQIFSIDSGSSLATLGLFLEQTIYNGVYTVTDAVEVNINGHRWAVLLHNLEA